MTDSLVIGAGVIGCATALTLAQNGLKVTLVDRGALGAEASWAGAGLLFPLLPWHYAPEVWELVAYSLRLFPEWIEHLREGGDCDPEFLQSGLIVLPPYDQAAAMAWTRARGFALSEGTAAVEGLRHRGPALRIADVWQVRNPRLMRALRNALTRAGVHLVEHEGVTGLDCRGGKVLGVRTAAKVYRPGTVVLSAGAWTPLLSAGTGLHSDMVPVRGQIELFKVEPGMMSSMVYRDGIYIVPRADGHLLAGSTVDYAGFDKTTTDDARTALIAAATGLVERLGPEHHVKSWAGLRPGSSHNIPLIARHPTIKNLFFNTGHFRYGVTMAPGSARLLADILLENASEIDRTAYQRADYFEPARVRRAREIRQSPNN